MADRGRDREAIRNVGDTSPRGDTRPVAPDTSGHSQPVDAGKTSGGGSSGHDQPDDVAARAKIRNQGGTRDKAALRDREPPEPLPELEP
jgi:hypothetical protein